MITKDAPHRYHSVLVTLHWLIALLILTEAAIGLAFHFDISWAPKRFERQIHMILGLAILAAVLVRVVVRFRTPKPPAATTGSRLLDAIGKATHALLYLAVIALTGSAVLFVLQANILGEVIGQVARHHGHFDKPLHLLLFLVLGAIVALHVAAALYHQFIRRDRLFSRMGYGRAPQQGAAEGRSKG